jgi:hypothetical protein
MMAKKAAYGFFQYTIAANEVKRIWFVSNYILLRSNTGASNTLQISIDGQEFQTIPVGTKIRVNPNPDGTSGISFIDVKNTDSVSTTFALQLADGEIDNIDLSISGTLTVNPSATAIVSGTAVTATTTAGATSFTPAATCRTLDIYNNGSFPVWVGDSTVNGSTGKGIPVLAGEKISLDNSAQVYFHAVGGSSQLTFNEHRRA